MRTESVKNLEHVFLKLKKIDNNVNGVGIGKKITNNVETDKNAIIVFVNIKIEKESIDLNKIIPSTITIDNTDIITDVVSVKYDNCPSCYPDADSLSVPSTSSPIYNNRTNLAIISGGCNFTKWTPPEVNTFCTLGGIFKDKLDSSYVGLTNRHCVDRIFYIELQLTNKTTNTTTLSFEYRTFPFTNYYGYTNFQQEYEAINNPTYDITSINFVSTVQNYNIRNTHYFNPSRFADIQSLPPVDALSGANCIGFFKRAVPVLPVNENTEKFFNYVDGALIGITNKLNASSKNQIGFNYNGQIQVATDEEIDLIVENKLPLFYSGSRSGPVGAPGSDASCFLEATTNIRIFEIEEANRSIKFSDENFGSSVIYQFSDCVEYKASNQVALLGGDSGSIIWGQLSTGWKIVGLNFANSTNRITGEIRGLFCRITNVFKALNIEVWNGESLNISNKTHEVILKDPVSFTRVADNAVEVVNDIEIDGKKYFFVGMANTNKYNDLDYKL